jgi:hypothetical protein
MLLLLGILNSPVTSFFVQNCGSAFRGGFYAYGKASLKDLPIPQELSTNSGRLQKIVELSKELLRLREKLGTATTPHQSDALKRQVSETDRMVSEAVFDLYGLTMEERTLATSSFSVG